VFQEGHLLQAAEIIHQVLVLLVQGRVQLQDHHLAAEVREVAQDHHQVVAEDDNPNLLKRKFKI
jgi:hypothetical protein